MAISDWNLEASEEVGQQEALRQEYIRRISRLERDIRNVEKATRFPLGIREKRITELRRQIGIQERRL